jgi:hypothetical protein
MEVIKWKDVPVGKHRVKNGCIFLPRAGVSDPRKTLRRAGIPYRGEPAKVGGDHACRYPAVNEPLYKRLLDGFSTLHKRLPVKVEAPPQYNDVTAGCPNPPNLVPTTPTS